MEQFIEFFRQQGFREYVVNVSRLSVFMTEHEDEDFVIALFDMPQGNEWSKEQCVNVEIQLRKKLKTQIDRKLTMFTFLCTREVENVREFYRQNDHTAVIDMSNHRLLIFEGLADDPLNIYGGMEEVLRKEELKSSNSYSNKEQGYNQGYNTQHKELRKFGLSHKINNIFHQVGLINCILIALNVGIFLILKISNLYTTAVDVGALYWHSVIEHHQYYRLITSTFLHGGIEHLLNNMLILAVIGGTLERAVGKLRYSIIYVLSGTIAGLVSIRYNMEQVAAVRSIGASGAIFGVIGAVLLIVLINKGRVGDLSKRQMILFVALSVYGGLINQGVDNAAHIGGLIAGFILAFLIYRRPKKRGVVS